SRIKSFGLDRIANINFEKTKFTWPKNFDINEMYRDSFGMITEGKVYDIVLSFDKDQRKYLGSLKIHHSQIELKSDEDDYRIGLRMKITYDLVKEILSYGDAVVVTKPHVLRNAIKQNLSNALSYYK